MPKGCWKVFLILVIFVGLMLALLIFYIVGAGDMKEPGLNTISLEADSIYQVDPYTKRLGKNWIHETTPGLYELYVEGSGHERGVAHGRLAQDLVQYQELVFTNQIAKMIPAKFYRNFLKYFIGWFNRDLEDYVPSEFKEEIFGISKFASDSFSTIGDPYERLMQYHAAHDIGHALQNLALVGCSSFATWTNDSTSTLLVGRNFDFYVGNDFAKNKVILFEKPDNGIPFMSVTWGGMIGVVSGMNINGLTVTLNAAKSSIPGGSATPISIVAREILQYASTIDEAVSIAKKRKIFVSESILVSSAKDNRAITIDMTPDSIAVFDPSGSYLIATNHFQSPELKGSKKNLEQIRESASMYRYERMMELVDTTGTNTPEKTAVVLRDYLGKGDRAIGLGNEKAVNQFICHHGIIFSPHDKKVWISINPWNLGEFHCYQLDKVFAIDSVNAGFQVSSTEYSLPSDSFLLTHAYGQLQQFKLLKESVIEGKEIAPDEIVRLNPEFYQAYVLAGEVLYRKEKFEEAKAYYLQALEKEIATIPERKYIEEQVENCNSKL